jgi:acyl-coenzyme A synthetase/AMP-(fatty) acid ligase
VNHFKWLTDRFNNEDTALIYRGKKISYLTLKASIETYNGLFLQEKIFHPMTIARIIRKLTRGGILDFEGKYLSYVPNKYTYNRIDKPTIILWTSGSSGEPKGVVHDATKLLAKFEHLERRPMKILAFLLIDHIGGLNTLFHTLSTGGSLVIPKSLKIDDVFSAIEKHKVEVLPTTPTFLRLALVSGIYKKYDLSSLKLVTFGTEPVGNTEIFRVMFPNALFKQTYGLSELGILSTKSGDDDWVKLGGKGYDIRVVDNKLEIKAESSMLGYLNAPSPFTEDGYFKTGDVVEVKGDYFRILGRESDIINVGGIKVFPQEIESIVNRLSEIVDSCAYPIANNITGQAVGLFITVVPDSNETIIKNKIIRALQGQLRPVKIDIKDTLHNKRFKKVRHA